MKKSGWDLTSKIDWSEFTSGEKLVFVEATHDSTEQDDGFLFRIQGLLDDRGRFHVIAHNLEVKE